MKSRRHAPGRSHGGKAGQAVAADLFAAVSRPEPPLATNPEPPLGNRDGPRDVEGDDFLDGP